MSPLAHTDRSITKTAMRAWMMMCFMLTGLVLLPSPAMSGETGRSAVDYIRVDPQDGVVRVKTIRKIARPASCQTTNFMVIPLNDPNLQLFLASLYTATATKGAVVRLFGSGSCTVLPGSETITKVTLFAPK